MQNPRANARRADRRSWSARAAGPRRRLGSAGGTRHPPAGCPPAPAGSPGGGRLASAARLAGKREAATRRFENGVEGDGFGLRVQTEHALDDEADLAFAFARLRDLAN